MEAFGILGFSFGSMAFIFAITAMTQIAALRKEVEKLKAELPQKGGGQETKA